MMYAAPAPEDPLTAQAVKSTHPLLYWQVGRRIPAEVLRQNRTRDGEQIISTLPNELAAEVGTGFSEPNPSRMMRFAQVFPDRQIVAALSRQLSWNPFVAIIALRDNQNRTRLGKGLGGPKT
jgi:hypothetical protein